MRGLCQLCVCACTAVPAEMRRRRRRRRRRPRVSHTHSHVVRTSRKSHPRKARPRRACANRTGGRRRRRPNRWPTHTHEKKTHTHSSHARELRGGRLLLTRRRSGRRNCTIGACLLIASVMMCGGVLCHWPRVTGGVSRTRLRTADGGRRSADGGLRCSGLGGCRSTDPLLAGWLWLWLWLTGCGRRARETVRCGWMRAARFGGASSLGTRRGERASESEWPESERTSESESECEGVRCRRRR